MPAGGKIGPHSRGPGHSFQNDRLQVVDAIVFAPPDPGVADYLMSGRQSRSSGKFLIVSCAVSR